MLMIDRDHQVVCVELVPKWEGTKIQLTHYISSSMYTLNKAGLIGEP
jgi:hypothetical protein